MTATSNNGALVFAILLTVALIMAVETFMTFGLARLLLSVVFSVQETYGSLAIAICLLQLLSYVISPQVCYVKGKAVRNTIDSVESQWTKAKPVKSCGVGFYKAGQVLWWGLPGMITFAPAVWKMDWVGKTVQKHHQVISNCQGSFGHPKENASATKSPFSHFT